VTKSAPSYQAAAFWRGSCKSVKSSKRPRSSSTQTSPSVMKGPLRTAANDFATSGNQVRRVGTVTPAEIAIAVPEIWPSDGNRPSSIRRSALARGSPRGRSINNMGFR